MDLEKFAREVFDSQPFSQFVGAELSKVGTDSAEISVPITDHLKQQHGYVHGGLISYVADNSITFAGGLALGGNALTSTSRYSPDEKAAAVRMVRTLRAELGHTARQTQRTRRQFCRQVRCNR